MKENSKPVQNKKREIVHLGTVGNSISNSTKRLDQLLFQLLAVLVHHHGLPRLMKHSKKVFSAAALVEELASWRSSSPK